MKNFLKRYGLLVMVILDVLTLGIVFHRLPGIVRPFEVMMGVTAGLGFLTAVFIRREWLRGGVLAIASMALAVFALEMGDKYLHITQRIIQSAPPPHIVGGGGKYAWDRNAGESYFDAYDRAVADGVIEEEDKIALAGDVFAGRDKAELVETIRVREKEAEVSGTVALKNVGEAVLDSPLGFEPVRNGGHRHFYRSIARDRYYYDGLYSFNRFGGRPTMKSQGKVE